jgi:hypothetical protein
VLALVTARKVSVFMLSWIRNIMARAKLSAQAA